jgi:hypothetical protein
MLNVLDIEGLAVEGLDFGPGTRAEEARGGVGRGAIVELEVYFIPSSGRGSLVYDASLFDAETAEMMASAFVGLLGRAGASGGRRPCVTCL